MTSTLKTNAIEPEGGTTNLVVGESGQNTVISNNDIRANVLQDSGGNAIFTSDGSGAMSGVNSGIAPMVLLSTQTASAAASVEFTRAITGAFTSAYKEYIFKFYNLHAHTDEQTFKFQGSVTTSGTYAYGILKTTTSVRAEHDVAGNTTEFVYWSDLAQSTSGVILTEASGDEASTSNIGELHLYNPASTTYVKHYIAITAGQKLGDGRNRVENLFGAGYFNTTSAITAMKFFFGSGNISCKIKMWGVK